MSDGNKVPRSRRKQLSPGAHRMVLYALSDSRTASDAYVVRALSALREVANTLIVLVPGEPRAHESALEAHADGLMHFSAPFSHSMYAQALTRLFSAGSDPDEVVLTGDGWFGPAGTGLAPVVDQMAGLPVDAWELVAQPEGELRDFAPQGFPVKERPALWLALRGELVDPAVWSSVGGPVPSAPALRRNGYVTSAAYESDALGHPDPALHAVPRLLEAGCPVLPSIAFTLYPPFLQQHAIIGREILDAAELNGFDISEVLAALARSVPPKALNTNLGLLDVLDEDSVAVAAVHRIAVLAHVTDLDALDELMDRVDCLPAGYDLYMTTTDGRKADRLRRRLFDRSAPGFARFEVRVTPASRGRDMSDMFIACRDVLLDKKYEIIVKVHARPMNRKTRILRGYFRRYQLENLLNSSRHVSAILGIFEREPGLGLVFPPMIHIGYQTMGRAWGPYREAARRVADRLGIGVPLDVVSPLAPYGGMFYARAEALRSLSEYGWTYGHYSHRGDRQYSHLARVQERLLVSAAAERGYHSRTVMTPEHAEISHTALEFKADQIFSTTTGYPVDQIVLLQRAGRTGRGGLVGLSRMYVSLNHPRLARVVLPVSATAESVFLYLKPRLSGAARAVRGANRKNEDR